MQVMDAFPDWIGELEVRLGHKSLLEAALVNAHVPKASLPPLFLYCEGACCVKLFSGQCRSMHIVDGQDASTSFW